MQQFKQLPQPEEIITAWIASWYNKTLMRNLAVRTAWNQHLKTGREVHIAELFGHLVIFDTREKADINRSGQLGKMTVIDLVTASIWNSTAHRASLKEKAPAKVHTLPRPGRKKNINRK